MNIDKWVSKLEECKQGLTMAHLENVKVSRNTENKVYFITKKLEPKVCRCCGTDLSKVSSPSIEVHFYDLPEHLSIFQANLLYLIFNKRTIPVDYARYHKSPAGQKFILSIREVKT